MTAKTPYGTGGTITTSGTQRIHTFNTGTSVPIFTCTRAGNVQLLVVAGGGGGGVCGVSGINAGGGGGAGEVFYSASYFISPGTYTISIGAGGAGGIPGTAGTNGGNTIFGVISANGGGFGGNPGNDGNDGGSGGGAARGGSLGGVSVKTAGGLGNRGGNQTNGPNFSAAGGGGATSVGTSASATGATPVPGGTGYTSAISGTSRTYATGGNGGARSGTYTPSPGLANRGDGGDGAPGGTGGAVQGADGAGGVVVISYTDGTSSVVSLTGTTLFSQLSLSAASSAVGAYSLRAVKGTSVKAVQVKRSSDSATQDFYADRLGNLWTVPFTGQLLQNWLGGAGANVLIWYDQSGRGNNATGAGSPIYATSNVNMQWAIRSGTIMTVTAPSPTLANTNFTLHSVTRRTTSSQAPGGGGTAITNQSIYAYTPGTSWPGTIAYNRFLVLYDYQGNRMGFNSVNTSIGQYGVIGNTGCGLYSAAGPVDYLAVTWNGTTTQMYYNASTSASTAAATFGNISVTNNLYLFGCPAYGAVVSGEFGEIIVFNSALSGTDISTLYSAR